MKARNISPLATSCSACAPVRFYSFILKLLYLVPKVKKKSLTMDSKPLILLNLGMHIDIGFNI